MLFEMRLKIFNLRHNVAARARFTRCVVDFEALHMNIDDGLNPYIDIRIMHNVVLYIQIYNIYFNTYPISLYFFAWQFKFAGKRQNTSKIIFRKYFHSFF